MMQAMGDRWASRLEQAWAAGRRSQQALILSALTGLLTGGSVALFDWVVSDGILTPLLRQPRWVRASAPLAASSDSAWFVSFYSGVAYNSLVDRLHRVRCVR